LKISFSGFIVGLIFIGLGCFLLAGTWGAYLDYKRLADYSGHTSAYITKKHVQKTADGNATYYLDYSFLPAAGSKIIVSGTVSKQQWDSFKVKDTLEIRYDSSKPDRHIPMYEPGSSPAWGFFMLVMGAVFLLFGGSRLFYSFRKRKA